METNQAGLSSPHVREVLGPGCLLLDVTMFAAVPPAEGSKDPKEEERQRDFHFIHVQNVGALSETTRQPLFYSHPSALLW